MTTISYYPLTIMICVLFLRHLGINFDINLESNKLLNSSFSFFIQIREVSSSLWTFNQSLETQFFKLNFMCMVFFFLRLLTEVFLSEASDLFYSILVTSIASYFPFSLCLLYIKTKSISLIQVKAVHLQEFVSSFCLQVWFSTFLAFFWVINEGIPGLSAMTVVHAGEVMISSLTIMCQTWIVSRPFNLLAIFILGDSSLASKSKAWCVNLIHLQLGCHRHMQQASKWAVATLC